MRCLYPNIKSIEIHNRLKIDFRFVLILIEKFRHIIVYISGKVEDKRIFIDEILKNLGVSNS